MYCSSLPVAGGRRGRLSGGQRRTGEGNVRGELGKSNAIEAAIDGWVTSGAGAFVSTV